MTWTDDAFATADAAFDVFFARRDTGNDFLANAHWNVTIPKHARATFSRACRLSPPPSRPFVRRDTSKTYPRLFQLPIQTEILPSRHRVKNEYFPSQTRRGSQEFWRHKTFDRSEFYCRPSKTPRQKALAEFWNGLSYVCELVESGVGVALSAGRFSVKNYRLNVC